MNAVRVTMFRGVRQNQIARKFVHAHSDLPLPIRPRIYDVLNLTGRRAGRLTVIGIAVPRRDGDPNNHGARYVVQCACGKYEHRTAKMILNPKPAHDRCQACQANASNQPRGK